MTEDSDLIICRCEEVTLGEIKKAVKEGAHDITGIKRRTRAGMGLCQGRSCEKLVQDILIKQLSKRPEEIKPDTVRPPVRPISFGSLKGK